jgi:hypothetical protein
MTAQREYAAELDDQFITDPPPAVDARGWPATADELESLWEPLRFRFWDPADLVAAIRRAGPFTPEQGDAIAFWWSLLGALEELGPRLYAAAFVNKSQQHDDDAATWSLVAMLRDELQHEQLCRLVVNALGRGSPGRYAPRTTLGRLAGNFLRQVEQESERCWRTYRYGLDLHGIAAVSGAMLLRVTTTAGLYERWAGGCAIPTIGTAFKHLAQDARRHQSVLRALVAKDWPALTPGQQSEAAMQVRATAKFLSVITLEPFGGQTRSLDDLRPGVRACEDAACQAGLGIPAIEERLETLRSALMEMRTLQARYSIPFQAMPELAILGTQGGDGSGR